MSKTILIVEDDVAVNEILVTGLARAGYKVTMAEAGDTALKKIDSERPDLIILDLMLPEINGIEIIKTLKAQPRTEVIPIIMLTAMAEEVNRVLGLELGADDYVTKPFNIAELLLRIRKTFERRAAAPVTA